MSKKILFITDSKVNERLIIATSLKFSKIKKESVNFLTISNLLKPKLSNNESNNYDLGYKIIELNSKIEIKYLLGITNVVNTLNKYKKLLTNRDKNSTVIFIDEFQFPNIFETLKRRQFEKIIIRTKNINKIKSFITKIKRIKNQCIKYYIYNDYIKLSSQLLNANQNNGKDFYIVIENNE